MNLLRGLDDFPDNLRGGAVAIGNFDGVHRGHAKLVERLMVQAGRVDGPAIVFTFDPHPAFLLRPQAAPPPLMWTDRKATLLAELGVHATIAFPTDENLLALSPREFFDQIVVQNMSARAMVEGPNFFFGRDRSGSIDTLAEYCRRSSIELEIVQPVVSGDLFVSSSRIRDALRNGDVDAARRMLTRPYRIRGMVTHGARRGAAIGFPTANIEAVDTLLPGVGVYAGTATIDQCAWPAAINIGPNPTFGEHAVKFETHLIGFEGSLYGRVLEVDFLTRLRDIHPFDSVEELRQQLHRDVEQARNCQ